MKRVLVAIFIIMLFCTGLTIADSMDIVSLSGPASGQGTYISNASTSMPPGDYVPVAVSTFDNEQRMLMAAPVTQAGGAKILLIEDVLPWGYPSNERAMQELGISYDRISSGSLATTDLSQYIMVIIASDQYTSTYNNLIKNKDKLANYVYNGGTLAAHCCDEGWNYGYCSGSFLPGGVTHVGSYYDYLSIIDPGSPIVSGITDAQLDGWYYSTHGYFTNVPAGAHVIIGMTGNPAANPTYIEYSYGSGTVLATMETIEWPWKRNADGAGFVAQKNLLRNELNYGYSGMKPDLAITGEDITFEKVV